MIYGVPQPQPLGTQNRVSRLVGTQIAGAAAAGLDILFQRPLKGIVRDVAAIAASALIVIPTPVVQADAPPPKILSGAPQAIEQVAPSRLIVVPVVTEVALDVLFQRPLTGLVQAIEVERPPTLIRIPFPDTVTAVDVLFQRPLAGRDQPSEGVRAPALITVPVAEVPPTPLDVLFQRPLVGLERRDPETRERVSRLVGGRLPFTEPPGEISILFYTPLRGRAHPVPPESESLLLFGLEPERFDLLFQRPLKGVEQRGPFVVPPSRVIKITPADVPPTPVNVLFQRPLTGLVQPVLAVPPSEIITIPFTDALNILFQRPLQGKEQETLGIVRQAFITPPPPPPPAPLNVLFQRPLVGIEREPIVVQPSQIVVVTPADVVVAGAGVYIPVIRRRRR